VQYHILEDGANFKQSFCFFFGGGTDGIERKKNGPGGVTSKL
jgi:hypothetical protein